MQTYTRIAIIGCAGSGKTTLARQLHTLLHIPVYHLDQYYWKPGWQRPDFEEFRTVHDELCDQESWIIEGIYTSALLYRLERTTHIIFIDIPRYRCLWRVIMRLLRNYHQVMPLSAPECPERFDIPFLQWVWKFKHKSRPYILHLLEEYKHEKKVYVLTTNEIPQLTLHFHQNMQT